jgi:hypothetical protein
MNILKGLVTIFLTLVGAPDTAEFLSSMGLDDDHVSVLESAAGL